MNVIGLDPGPQESAIVAIDSSHTILENVTAPNDDLLRFIRSSKAEGFVLAIEMIASYGMPVGADVFETVLWLGQVVEAWGGEWYKVYRRKKTPTAESVCMHLCKNMRAKDGNIRQSIIDMYAPTGKGKVPQIGTKKDPGPLYGISGHEWQALGVAITFLETGKRDEVSRDDRCRDHQAH